jgi:hypothetical protein
LHQIISITALASVSPLGKDPELIWQQYLNPVAAITEVAVGVKNTFVAVLDAESKLAVKELQQSDQKYKALDPSVLYAMLLHEKPFKRPVGRQPMILASI